VTETGTIKTLAQKITDAAAFAKGLEKTHGKNAMVRIGDRVGMQIPVIPTGFAEFDHEVLGPGGLPKGRMIEIFGPESSGKTSIALHIIAEVQKAGGLAGFIDAEHALDPTWAKKLRVDMDNLFVTQPDCGEQGLQIADEALTKNIFDLIVIDSVAALVPKVELEGEIGDAHVGLLPRMMAQTCRMFAGRMNKNETKTTVIFINQIREKIGVMYGNPETQPGGRALKFYASVRIDVRKTEWIKKGELPVGSRIRLKAIKNKVGSPFRDCLVDLMFEDGFNLRGGIVDLAIARNVLYKEGNGTTFFFKGKKLEVGALATKLAVLEDSDLYDAVSAELTAKLKEAKQ
jgi:recombination protein RecA